jgi:hypothetical protein
MLMSSNSLENLPTTFRIPALALIFDCQYLPPQSEGYAQTGIAEAPAGIRAGASAMR